MIEGVDNPLLQLNVPVVPLAVAVIVSEEPLQTTKLGESTITVGNARTVRITVCVVEQPFGAVVVT
jgi:hypothetical protein